APQPQAGPPAHSQDPEPPRETGDASSNPGPGSGSASAEAQDSAQPSSAAQPVDRSAAASSAPVSDHVMTRPGRDVPEPARVSEPRRVLQPDSATTVPVSAPQPAGGAYLQVGAVSKVDAENLVRTLKEEKLP